MAGTFETAPLRILYAYHMDPQDPRVQSGRPHSIYRQMLASGHRVDVIQIVPRLWHKPIAHQLLARLRGQFYGGERSPGVARLFQRKVQHALGASGPYDVIFSPSTLPFALPLSDVAVKVACVDTMFDELIGTYPQFANAAPNYVHEGRAHDRATLSNLDLLVVPARVAADCAVRYGAREDQLLIAPFGGNLGVAPREESVAGAISERAARATIDFLFVGKDWERKNGSLVTDVARAVRARGISSTVHAIGCSPFAGYDARSDPVIFYGDVNLAQAEGAERLFQLSRLTAFFFVPSRAEAYGMAFVEAAALGLPLLGAPVGGIQNIINAANGRTFGAATSAEAIADELIALQKDTDRYVAMSNAARATALTTHNWPAFWSACEQSIRRIRDDKRRASGI